MTHGKHTPGPWEIREGTYGHAGTYDWQIVNKDDEYVCDGDGEANALIIAAAPDLLEALQKCYTAFKRYEQDVDDIAPLEHTQMMRQARAAIAKATGVQS